MGRPSMNELTNRVARDKSQMTRTIKSFEAKGLIERETSPDDARVSVVFLDDAGEAVVRGLQTAVAETITEILTPISDTEEMALKGLLERVLT